MDVSELWREYNSELIGYLQKSTHSMESAEDVASEVFLKALGNRSLLSAMHPKQCRLWLYTTAKHILIDIGRRKRLESRIIPDPDLTEDDLSKAMVSEVIAKLPDDLQDLVAMRYFSDMDSTTIGRIMGVPPTTVRTRLHRACMLLRKYWNENEEE